MLTIIHGSDISLSRRYFLDEKNKIKDALLLDAEKITLTDLAQIFDGGGLFGETQTVFIEQLLTKRKKGTEHSEIFTYLEKKATENAIFLWEGKELERGALNIFKKAIVKPFKLPQTLFAFLDEIKPGNGKRLILLLHQTIETTEVEMVFFMLVRQFRMLLALADQTPPRHSVEQSDSRIDSGQARMTDQIDEVKRMAPWQLTKLQKQARSFDISHLFTTLRSTFSNRSRSKNRLSYTILNLYD